MFKSRIVKVRIGDEVIKVEENTIFKDIIPLVSYVPENSFGIIVDNENHSFNYKVTEDCTCEFITYGSEEGVRIYTRSLKYILIMAFRELYKGKGSLKFSNKISQDVFIRVRGVSVDDNAVQSIKQKMLEIIKEDYEIIKIKATSRETYKRIKSPYQEDNFIRQFDNLESKFKNTYTLHVCNEETNYLYGDLVPSTGCIKGFDVRKGRQGIVLVLPEKDNISNVCTNLSTDNIDKLFSDLPKPDITSVLDLNGSIADGKTKEIISCAEANQNNEIIKLSEILQQSKIKIVFVSGPSSSGKTTFSYRLQENLLRMNLKSRVISMDNYFQELENIPVDKHGEKDYESIYNVDIDLFTSQMNKLIKGESVIIPEYDFGNCTKKFNEVLNGNEVDILIVEGIHALNPLITSKISNKAIFKIYVAPMVTLSFDDFIKVSSSDIRLIRRIVRDRDTRECSVEKTLELWNKVRKGEQKWIYPYLEESDYFFNTNLVYELCVLKPYIERLLFKVRRDSKAYLEARRLNELVQNFLSIGTDEIPEKSLIREFIGNGCFKR